MRIDTQLTAGLAMVPTQAALLEAAGIDGVFTFEGPHDVFFPLALATEHTSLEVMTNVAIAFPRNPIHLAHQANDLQLLSGGRFRLGLGPQIRAQIERRFGLEWSRPVDRMRELVLAVKAIWACWNDDAPLDFDGEFYRHELMTFAFDPGPNPYGPPPILLGALGPRMTRMAAEVADGLLVMPFNTARSFRELTLPAVDAGLAAAGRAAADFEICAQSLVAVGRSDEEQSVADEGVRGLLAFYGSTRSYRPILETEGWGDLQLDLHALSKQGRWDEMTGLIDDAMLDALSLRGPPATVADQMLARFGDRPDRFGFTLPYPAAPDLIGEVAEALSA